MTTNKFKIIAIAVVCAIGAVSCNNDDNNGDAMVSADFQGLCTTRSNGETSYKHCFIVWDNLKMTLMLRFLLQWVQYQPIFQSRLLA
jgi:hypothetical protein